MFVCPEQCCVSHDGVVVCVGQGAFAKVYKAKCAQMKKDVAIKIMDLEKITTSFEDIRAEVQTMKMTNHRNVLSCYCSFVHKDQLWLVMQLMNKGSCLHVMNLLKRKGLGEGLREEFCAIILREALQGLQYFHENGQIHRDIKAGNILLDSEGHVVIADFGVSGWMMEAGDRRKNRQTVQRQNFLFYRHDLIQDTVFKYSLSARHVGWPPRVSIFQSTVKSLEFNSSTDTSSDGTSARI